LIHLGHIDSANREGALPIISWPILFLVCKNCKRKRILLEQNVHLGIWLLQCVFETDVGEVQACLIDGAGAFIAVNVTENR